MQRETADRFVANGLETPGHGYSPARKAQSSDRSRGGMGWDSPRHAGSTQSLTPRMYLVAEWDGKLRDMYFNAETQRRREKRREARPESAEEAENTARFRGDGGSFRRVQRHGWISWRNGMGNSETCISTQRRRGAEKNAEKQELRAQTKQRAQRWQGRTFGAAGGSFRRGSGERGGSRGGAFGLTGGRVPERDERWSALEWGC